MRSFLRWLGVCPCPAPVQPINPLHWRLVDEIIAGERILITQDARDIIAWMHARMCHLEEKNKFYVRR